MGSPKFSHGNSWGVAQNHFSSTAKETKPAAESLRLQWPRARRTKQYRIDRIAYSMRRVKNSWFKQSFLTNFSEKLST
jgi:hypothetical protein